MNTPLYIPYPEYAAIPAINAGAIVAGMKSMLHMHAEMTHTCPTDSPAMRWGRLAHMAILEPDRFFAEAVVWPGGRKAGKEWERFVADCGDDEMILTQDELDKLADMSAMIHKNRDAHHLISTTGHEVSLTWDQPLYGQGKCRADILSDDGAIVADYKTARSIVQRDFWRSAWSLGYHIKMGWYAHGIAVLTGRHPSVRVIVQENVRPFDCWVCVMPPALVEKSAIEAVEIARRYNVHRAIGTFPGVVPSGVMIDYELPAWATEEKEERLDDGEGEATEL
jgi:exodeoxyribonuclease VIII